MPPGMECSSDESYLGSNGNANPKFANATSPFVQYGRHYTNLQVHGIIPKGIQEIYSLSALYCEPLVQLNQADVATSKIRGRRQSTLVTTILPMIMAKNRWLNIPESFSQGDWLLLLCLVYYCRDTELSNASFFGASNKKVRQTCRYISLGLFFGSRTATRSSFCSAMLRYSTSLLPSRGRSSNCSSFHGKGGGIYCTNYLAVAKALDL